MYNCKCHYIRIKMARNCYEEVGIDKSMYCFLIKFVLCLHGKADPPSHINTMTILREKRAGARFSKVSVTFRARKAVLCLLSSHSRSKFQQF